MAGVRRALLTVVATFGRLLDVDGTRNGDAGMRRSSTGMGRARRALLTVVATFGRMVVERGVMGMSVDAAGARRGLRSVAIIFTKA